MPEPADAARAGVSVPVPRDRAFAVFDLGAAPPARALVAEQGWPHLLERYAAAIVSR
jgi:hypothetical protein